MSSADRKSVFPLMCTILALTAVAALVWPVAAGLTALANVSESNAQWTVAAAVVIAWFSAVLGVMPVAILGPWGLMPTVYGYFLGASLRLAMVLGVCLVLVFTKALPFAIFALVLVGTYIPLLFVEAGVVGRFLWRMDELPASQQPNQPTATDPPSDAKRVEVMA